MSWCCQLTHKTREARKCPNNGIIVTWEISSSYVHISPALNSAGYYVHSFRYNCRLDLLYIHFRLWSDAGYRHFVFFSPFHTYCHIHQVSIPLLIQLVLSSTFQSLNMEELVCISARSEYLWWNPSIAGYWILNPKPSSNTTHYIWSMIECSSAERHRHHAAEDRSLPRPTQLAPSARCSPHQSHHVPMMLYWPPPGYSS
jgi:hypothetical protein